MPKELFERVNLDLYYPPFLERLMVAKARARTRGYNYVSLEGHRAYSRSDLLHTDWQAGKGGRAAPGGRSSHNFGLADDSVLDISPAPGLQPDWKDAAATVWGEELTRVSLHWGAGYGDRLHSSWPGFVSAMDLRLLDRIYRRASGNLKTKLRAVWDYVTVYGLALPPLEPT